MSETAEAIYAELDAANRQHDFLRAVNTFSLDTAEKRLAWDVAYAHATDRLMRALAAKNALVRAALTQSEPGK